MIRQLRDRHRWMIPLIGLIAAVALAIALMGRHPRNESSIPAALQPHREAR